MTLANGSFIEESPDYGKRFLEVVADIAGELDHGAVDRIAERLSTVREMHGRVFLIGVGGGAANATHAVCDLRNLTGLEAYSATDNAATLTASINDRGWRTAVADWLAGSNLRAHDAVMVFSVGGGSEDPPVSVNLIEAMKYAARIGAFTCGVVGPSGGEAARLADECVRVPVRDRHFQTTHTEIYQAVVWHMLALHPALARDVPKWESFCR